RQARVLVGRRDVEDPKLARGVAYREPVGHAASRSGDGADESPASKRADGLGVDLAAEDRGRRFRRERDESPGVRKKRSGLSGRDRRRRARGGCRSRDRLAWQRDRAVGQNREKYGKDQDG